MIFIFKDLEIQFRPCLAWEIIKVYGIGYQKAINVLSYLGISFYFAVSYLNYYFFESISYIIKYFYLIDDKLRAAIRARVQQLLKLKIRRGIRFSKGLPVRGQRTHSNGKQNKYHKKNEI